MTTLMTGGTGLIGVEVAEDLTQSVHLGRDVRDNVAHSATSSMSFKRVRADTRRSSKNRSRRCLTVGRGANYVNLKFSLSFGRPDVGA